MKTSGQSTPAFVGVHGLEGHGLGTAGHQKHVVGIAHGTRDLVERHAIEEAVADAMRVVAAHECFDRGRLADEICHSHAPPLSLRTGHAQRQRGGGRRIHRGDDHGAEAVQQRRHAAPLHLPLFRCAD